MTIFEDLRKDYQIARETSLEYQRSSALFAQRLARRFQIYIGAPDNYRTMKQDDTRWYVQPMRTTLRGHNDFVSETPEGLHDLLTKDEDGYWLVGLRLTLDIAANAFPKDNFVFLLKFTIRGGECEMSVGFGKDARKFQADDDEGIKPIFDNMISQLKELFARKPWDMPKKNTIGFTAQSE